MLSTININVMELKLLTRRLTLGGFEHNCCELLPNPACEIKDATQELRDITINASQLSPLH